MSYTPEKLKDYLSARNRIYRDYVFQYSNIDEYVYKDWFDHRGIQIFFPEERVLYTLDDYDRMQDYDYEVLVFVNGIKLPSDSFDVIRALGSNRLYLKRSYVNNNDVVEIIIAKNYDREGKHFQNPPSRDTTDFSFYVPMYTIGSKHDSKDDIVVLRRRSTDNFHKPLWHEHFEYSIEKTYPYNWKITIHGVTKPTDQIMVINKRATGKTYKNMSHIKDIPGFGKVLPLCDNNGIFDFPISRPQEIDIYIDGKKLCHNFHYKVLINKQNEELTPVIQFFGELNDNYEFEIRTTNKSFSHTISKELFLRDIDKTGLIDLGCFGVPLKEDFIEVFVNSRKIPITDIEIIADEILLIKNLKSLKNLHVRMILDGEERTRNLIEEYKNMEKNSLLKQIRNMGFENWRNAQPYYNVETQEEFIIFQEASGWEIPLGEGAFFDYFIHHEPYGTRSLNANLLHDNYKVDPYTNFMTRYSLDANKPLTVNYPRSVSVSKENIR